jgi:CHASE3 domain sensor protein
MTIRSLSNRRLVFAFGVAVAVLLVVGAFSYRGLVVSRESDRWVRHSHEVLENLDELLFAVASIESSSRGFVLTGEDSYLASDHANISSAEQHLAAVRKLTVDNPDQQRQLPVLERLVAQKIQFAEEAINLRRAKGLEAGSDAIQSGQGQRVMDEFQAVVRQWRTKSCDCWHCAMQT